MENSCGNRPHKDLGVAVTGSGKVDAPWAVSIGKYFEDGSFNHYCTGSIIAPGIILSAAHCITSRYFDIGTYRVRAGVTNLANKFGEESGIRKTAFHSEWQKNGKHQLYYDLALFFLKDSLTFSPTIQPICLPTMTYPSLPDKMVGYGLTTVGWGRDDQDVIGGELTQIDVTIRSNEECNTIYGRTSRANQIRLKKQLPDLLKTSQLCADNNINTQIGTCNGDSGGPSFVRKFLKGEQKFFVVGVTSGSVQCGGGTPDFYTYLQYEQNLAWVHKAAAEDEERLSLFNHIEDLSSIHCATDTDCPNGLFCAEGLCFSSLSASGPQSLNPSPECQDDRKPCLIGGECREPTCNRFGSACWCQQGRKRRSAQERQELTGPEERRSYVQGAPQNWTIDCTEDYDCPPDWFCAEQTCYPPLSYPSAAWEALSAPVVSRVGKLKPGAIVPLQGCLCLPHCTSPVCNSKNRCWCQARGWSQRRRG